MLVDAETLLPARDGWSRVFGEATQRILPELFESFVEITTPSRVTLFGVGVHANTVTASILAVLGAVRRAAARGLTAPAP